MRKMDFVCPCLLGIEGLLSNELKRMCAENVLSQNGRVTFSGDYNILARANICSRYAERVLILMGSFRAENFEELFQGVKKLAWEDLIGKNDAFPVKGSSLNSKLFSVPDCQSIIKKAIVERLKERYNVPWFEETGALFSVQFLIMKDIVSVMVDTSGAGLHKRGYRKNSTEAPIKETLAAAMVNLAHVRSSSTVYDPFCGSGTILIEAALYAMNIAPGINRRFIAESWPWIQPSIWNNERQRALEGIRRNVEFQAFGYDIDKNAIELTKENAKKAGVEAKIKVEKQDIKDFKALSERGIIICNPPYGERLLDVKRVRELYETMGKVFKKQEGMNYYIISPDEDFESYFLRKSQKRRKLYNGMIKCQYHMYFNEGDMKQELT
ncbi:MAG: Ribosomal RNA large subunit methyltransferase L [Eubacteriales bacterium SKADARSKE-1]|nr:Ribosomal RNA large subunit methyltransferase L [Eubacteriales bacterium SKADARSKE-1]